MTIELIFGIVQALITAILGSFTKRGKLPKRYIPIQNIVVGLIAGLLAVYFNIYDDAVLSIFICLATSLGVGGAYDATQTKKKGE